MQVYHYSEDATISVFEPRASRLGEPLVWAICKRSMDFSLVRMRNAQGWSDDSR